MGNHGRQQRESGIMMMRLGLLQSLKTPMEISGFGVVEEALLNLTEENLRHTPQRMGLSVTMQCRYTNTAMENSHLSLIKA